MKTVKSRHSRQTLRNSCYEIKTAFYIALDFIKSGTQNTQSMFLISHSTKNEKVRYKSVNLKITMIHKYINDMICIFNTAAITF